MGCRLGVACGLALGLLGGLLSQTQSAAAQAAEGELTVAIFSDLRDTHTDKRFTDIRNGDIAYTFRRFRSPDEWAERAAGLRRHILATCGLWPPPPDTPLNAEVFGRVERDGYSVEKVYLESFPGFYMTGNLYRPLGKEGPFPAIASPHGHWGTGRLHSDQRGSVPGRAITFARLGFVVLTYDMVGYNDSFQVDHRFQGDREALWGISPMALQLRNGLRVVDFLAELPDVDAERIACTGASGGGTQTFMLMAVDDRVKVAAPVNMISAHFQGGCVCENAPNLRIDTYNVEIGATMAPRPMIMVCCTGDWTVNTPAVEFPAIKSIYDLLGAPDKIAWKQVDAEHNYNQESREAVYEWFSRWLLGAAEDVHIAEPAFEVEPNENLLVWHGRERPAGALDQASVVQYLIQEAKLQAAEATPRTPEDVAALRDRLGSTLAHSLNVAPPDDVSATALGETQVGEYRAEAFVLSGTQRGDAVPLLFIPAPEPAEERSAVVVVHEKGSAGLLGRDGSPRDIVEQLLARGHAVALVDTFGTGASRPPKGQRGRATANFFTTFNRTDTAERVQDILTAIAYVGSRIDVGRVDLLGLEAAGLWGLLARAFAPSVERTALDLAAFAGGDAAYTKQLFVPLLQKAGGLQTAGALAAPGRLLLHRVSPELELSLTEAAYDALAARGKLRAEADRLASHELVEWLCS